MHFLNTITTMYISLRKTIVRQFEIFYPLPNCFKIKNDCNR